MALLDRKAALVEAAFSLIAREGIAAATTRAVTGEAGMSLASFHYAFPSRDALFAELIEFSLERERLAQSTVADDDLPIEERVYQGFLASLEVTRRDPGSVLAMFELQSHALRTPGLEDLARRQYERYWDTAERFVLDTGRRWDRPAREIAQVLVAANDGVALAWLATRDDGTAERMIRIATASICEMAL